MFRIELMADDKKLADVLRAVQGLATVVGCPQPVVNADIKNGKLTARSNGSAAALFDQFLQKHKITEVTAGVAREFSQSIGRNANSANYLLNKGVEHGSLRLQTKGGTQKGKGAVYAVQLLIPPPKKKKAA